jgi:hypothetical protein
LSKSFRGELWVQFFRDCFSRCIPLTYSGGAIWDDAAKVTITDIEPWDIPQPIDDEGSS